MERPPVEPHPSLVPFEPVATRSLPLYGTTVQLALVPSRRARTGHVHSERPPLARSRAGRILAEEAIWQTDSLVLTPNKFPFGVEQRILWMGHPAREPDRTFWQAALSWVDASDGTVLLNNIGAAATIPRAHAHLINERMPFVPALPERPLTTDLIDVPDGCELVCKDVPYCMIGVRGDIAGKAEAILRLADARLTATWNVVLSKDAAWIVPRGKEVPVPFFDQAIGSAEMWGRWCYVDEEPFAAATSQDLEQALLVATRPPVA